MVRKTNPTAIGAFVVGAIALAVIGVAVFGSGRYFTHTEKFVMFFPGSVNGLSAGAPVKFKGVPVGQVTDISLVFQENLQTKERLTIPVYVETEPDKIMVDGKPLEMYDPANIRRLIGQGMRAQLQQQSLVTGLLFVQIDFFPGTPVNYVLPQPSKPMEIPTVPTTMEEASSAAREIIDELRNIKFGPMVQNLSEAVQNVNKLLASPALQQSIDGLPRVVNGAGDAMASLRKLSDDLRGRVPPLAQRIDSTLVSADQAMDSIRDMARDTRTLIAPDSPLDHELRHTLRGVSDAARALSQLADYLERNPSAVLYGKPPQQHPVIEP